MPDTETLIVIPGVSIPGATARVQFVTRSELLGADANGMLEVSDGGFLRIELLAGFRYLRLKEEVVLDAVTTGIPTSQVSIISDRFTTRNNFYGGQA